MLSIHHVFTRLAGLWGACMVEICKIMYLYHDCTASSFGLLLCVHVMRHGTRPKRKYPDMHAEDAIWAPYSDVYVYMFA